MTQDGKVQTSRALYIKGDTLEAAQAQETEVLWVGVGVKKGRRSTLRRHF